MLHTEATTDLPELRLVLRTAVAHARYRLARWIEPNGISQEECLTELTQLLFHPAIDVVTASNPATNDESLRILWQATRDSRDVLLRYCGPNGFLAADECLDALLGILDNRQIMDAGDLRAMIAVIQWGPAVPRRRRAQAWCIRRALGSECMERVFIDVSSG
jgi:hypothetical protein